MTLAGILKAIEASTGEAPIEKQVADLKAALGALPNVASMFEDDHIHIAGRAMLAFENLNGLTSPTKLTELLYNIAAISVELGAGTAEYQDQWRKAVLAAG